MCEDSLKHLQQTTGSSTNLCVCVRACVCVRVQGGRNRFTGRDPHSAAHPGLLVLPPAGRIQDDPGES